MPSFPGGRDAMMNYLKDNINYPKDAIKEGQVVAEFIVSKDGSIGDIKIIRSLDEACDAEVKRVLMAMPDWQPGKQFGEAVPVYFMLPVTFKKK
jgi:TonB family protein